MIGVDPIKAYICDEGLARFCTQKYQKPTKENFRNQFIHLTNYSVNKMADNYVRPSQYDCDHPSNATKRTLTSLKMTCE